MLLDTTTPSTLKEGNALGAPTSVSLINTVSYPINTGLIKALGQSKYGSLPLKKPPAEVQLKPPSLVPTSEVVVNPVVVDEESSNEDDEDEDEDEEDER